MKEKLLLVGAGGLGRVALEHACEEYECYFVDDGYRIGDKVDGTEIIGHTDNLNELFSFARKLVVTIGNNKIREKLYTEAGKIGFSFPNIICKSAYISRHASIGHGCIILNNVVIQNGAKVGDGVILNPGVEIHHDSLVNNNVVIYGNSVVRTGAEVGNRVKIGSNQTIGNFTVVKDDRVIGE